MRRCLEVLAQITGGVIAIAGVGIFVVTDIGDYLTTFSIVGVAVIAVVLGVISLLRRPPCETAPELPSHARQ